MADLAFEISSIAKLEESGVLERPLPNSTFLLDRGTSVWFVQSGTLDLFLVAFANGELAGPRHPLLRIQKSEAAVGIFPEDGLAILAAVGPDTVLRRMELADVGAMIAAGDEFALSLLETWINAISTVTTSGKAPPSLVESLEPGATLTIADSPKILAARGRLAWIYQGEGESHFLGNLALPLRNAALFPLAKQGWIESQPGSEVKAVSPLEIPRLDPQWDGLKAFFRCIMLLLVEQLRQGNETERERVKTRALADNNLLHQTMLWLAATIQKQPGTSSGTDSCHHPVFLACQAIAERMGFVVKAHPEMLRGLPVDDPVAAVARASGIRARRVTLKRDWWQYDNGFLVAFREDNNSPIAILPNKRSGSDAYDPVEDTYVHLNEELAEKLNPSAYVLYRPFASSALDAVDLLRFSMAGCRKELLTIFFTSVGASLLLLLPPYAVGIIFDRLIPGAEKGQLWQMCLFLITATISASLLTLGRGFALLRLQGRIDATVQAALWDRMLSLPVSFFREYSSGDLAQRCMGISHIREILTGGTLAAVFSGLFSVFAVALLFHYSWRLALVALGLVLLAGLASLTCGIWQVRIQRLLITRQGKISSTLLQFITGVSKFRVSGTEHRAFSFWGRLFSTMKQSSAKARRVSNLLSVFNSIFPVICTATFFYCYFAFPSIGEGLTTGSFVAFLATFTQFLFSVLTLSGSVVSALAIIPIYERVVPLLRAVPEVNEAKTTPGRLSGEVELSHVTFSYKKDAPPVLRDISLKIGQGQFVAFVGASGSGKSTLFRLLLGFETPDSGAIYFDSQDLTGLDIQSVRRQMGVVLQTSKPISGSIYENIVGSAPLTLDEAWTAATAAGLDADIRRMPMGLHTQIADGGGGISGGQRQRLLIARAIVGRPRILVFDEATSALDNRTQEIVSRSLESLQATRIVIAHRLSTIVNADRIFVLDKGAIVQSGTYADLVSQEGLFKILAERQLV